VTDAQLEGEKGYGGDAVGISLKSSLKSSVQRAYLEFIVAPPEQCIYIKRWQSVKRPARLSRSGMRQLNLINS
jgi:hypothetical protein